MLTYSSNNQNGGIWYLVRLASGSVAVISSEDLEIVVSLESAEFVAGFSLEEAKAFEAARAALCPRPVV
jgi:hypothetical protein